MTAAFGSAGTLAHGTGVTTLTPALPGTVNAGDLLIVFIATGNVNLLSEISFGSPWVYPFPGDSFTGAEFSGPPDFGCSNAYFVANGSQVAPVITWSTPCNAAAIVYRFTGTKSGTAWNGVGSYSSTGGEGTGVTHQDNALTTSAANSLVVYFDASVGDNTGLTTPSGYTGNSSAGDASAAINLTIGSQLFASSGSNTGSPVAGGGIVSVGGSQSWSLTKFELLSAAGTITPGCGSLSITGQTCSVTRQDTIKPPQGALALTGFGVVMGFAMTPATGALTITGPPPNLIVGVNRTPGVGALTLVGNTSTTNTRITPAAGSLTFTGFASAEAVTVTPAAASVAFSGQTAVVLLNTILTPPVGTLTFSGNAPGLIAGRVIVPGVGSLTLSGSAGTTNNNFVTGVGALTLAGFAPQASATQAGTIQPFGSSLILTGMVPSLTHFDTIHPGVGSLSLSGFAPLLNLAMTPSTGTLGLTGFAPSSGANATITPPCGALGLTGFASGMAGNLMCTPGCGALALNGYIPSPPHGPSLRIDTTEWIANSLIIGNTGLGLLGPAISTQGYAYHDLSFPANNINEICGRIVIQPTAGTLYAYEDTSFTFTGAPAGTYFFQYQLYVDGVPVGSPENVFLDVAGVIAPPAASPAFTGYAPSVNTGQLVIIPDPGSLALTGYIPALSGTGGASIVPDPGSLLLTGYQPGVTTFPLIFPGSGEMDITGYAPVVVGPVYLVPGCARLGITGYPANPFGPIEITPDCGTLSVVGYASNEGVFRPGIKSVWYVKRKRR